MGRARASEVKPRTMMPSRSTDGNVTEGAVDLRELFATIARRKGLVIGITVLVTILAGLYSYTRRPVYTSQADVLIRPILTNPVESFSPNQIDLQTEIRIATSTAVAHEALSRLDPQTTLATLLKNVSVNTPSDAMILEISYSAFNARDARLGAQTFAEAYLDFKSGQAVESIARRTAALQGEVDKIDEQIATLNADIAGLPNGSADRADLIEQRSAVQTTRLALQNQLATVSTLSSDPGQVIQPAALPTSPSRPKHRLDLVLGALLGLLLGIGMATIGERFRDPIGGADALEQALEAPVLGVIPTLPAGRHPASRPVTVAEPRSLPAEAFRTLRTNLLAVSGRSVRTLLVTSALPGEGKTTAATNLAVAIAQIGRDVVLISADLRSPDTRTPFGLENDRGLGQVLKGEVRLEEAVCATPIPHLTVLPSGPVAEILDPVELLQSDRMLDVIARCADLGTVVIDGAPLLAVADSVVLATMVDAVLLVASARRSRRSSSATARRQLRQVDANLVGAVLNGVSLGRREQRGYGSADLRRSMLARAFESEPHSNGRSVAPPAELEELESK
jgi:succinoglycan biosynthesis transport protein ExoP